MKPRRKVFLQYAALTVVACVAAVVLAEVYLASTGGPKWNLPFYNRLYPYVMFRPTENLTYISSETFEMSHHTEPVHYYSNADALRVSAADYALPKEKPPAQLRFAVLGGSAVEVATNFEATLPGSLKTVLLKEHPGYDIEVINGGIQSSISRQAVLHFLFTVSDYHPDVVVLYDGQNDLGLPLMYDGRSNYPYNFQTMQEAWDVYRSEHQASLFQVMLDRSYLYAALRARMGSDETATTTNTVAKAMGRGPYAKAAEDILNDPDYVKEYVSSYLANWRQIIKLSTYYEYQPVFVLQATGGVDRDYSIAALKAGYFGEDEPAAHWVDAFIALYDEAGRQMEEMRAEHPDVIFLNLSDFLQPSKEHFWDGVHVYDEVNLKLAARIYEEIQGMVESRLSSVPKQTEAATIP